MLALDIGECRSNIPNLESFLLSKFQDTSIFYMVGEGGKLPIPCIADQILGKRRKTLYV
jgi:hypothetical protein